LFPITQAVGHTGSAHAIAAVVALLVTAAGSNAATGATAGTCPWVGAVIIDDALERADAAEHTRLAATLQRI
jgi:hypothetical protein